MASPVLLGPQGVKRALNIPRLSDWELNELSKALWHVNTLSCAGQKLATKLVREQEKVIGIKTPKEDPDVLRAALKKKGLMLN